jgi:hypothetical protein
MPVPHNHLVEDSLAQEAAHTALEVEEHRIGLEAVVDHIGLEVVHHIDLAAADRRPVVVVDRTDLEVEEHRIGLEVVRHTGLGEAARIVPVAGELRTVLQVVRHIVLVGEHRIVLVGEHHIDLEEAEVNL